MGPQVQPALLQEGPADKILLPFPGKDSLPFVFHPVVQQPDQLALACDQSIQAVLARQQQIDVVLPLIVGGHGLRHKPFLPRRGIIGKQPFAAKDVQLSLIAFNIGDIGILLCIEQIAV